MSHRFSLAYLTVPGVTPPEQTELAARAGYDAVSLRLHQQGVPGEPEVDVTSSDMVTATKRALDATGLHCLDIELMRILRGVNIADYERAFAAGAELGATQAISSAWTDVRNDRGFVVERFAELCDLARPYGISVNLEFPAFSRLTTLEEAVDILERVRAPNQGVLVDTLYMHFNKAPLFQLERLPDEWVNFIHICDAEDLVYTKEEMIAIARDGRLYPGEGAIDFEIIDNLFPDVPLAIELPNAARLAEFGHEGHARRCLEAARAALDGANGSRDQVQSG